MLPIDNIELHGRGLISAPQSNVTKIPYRHHGRHRITAISSIQV
jgi:hypothetical protein